MVTMSPRLALAFAFGLLASGCTAPERGSWWYRHPGAGDSHGIEEVFQGTGALTTTGVADAAVACGLTRVYGSYGPMTGTPSASQVAAFNVELHDRGVRSSYLFSDSSYLTNPSSLYAAVTDRVVNFNAARSNVDEQFDAVHLDVEPVDFPACKQATLDPAACLDVVVAWRFLVADVREILAGAEPPIELEVDMHEWLDVTPGGRVGWPADPTPEAARDDFFVGLDVYPQRFTIMTYDHTSPGDVWNALSYEDAHLTKEVRAGLNLDATSSFPDVPSLLAGAALFEATYGLDTDLHDLNQILAAGGC